MKARLMKYIPSTSATVRKKIVWRRPWASGWRATPWMYDEPASPSPTPAPMAPPARAIPPPMKAPAVVMAELSTATVTPWFRAACPAQRVYLWCGRARRSGRRFWGGFAGRCLVAGLGVIGDSLVVVVAGAGHAEV